MLWGIHGKVGLSKGRLSKKIAPIARGKVRIAMGKFAHIAEELERLRIVDEPNVTSKKQSKRRKFDEANT